MNLHKWLHKFAGSGPAMSIAKKGGSFLANHVIGIVVLFSLSSYITRTYGSEYWGKVALMMTVVTLGATISVVGLDVYLVRLLGFPNSKDYKLALLKKTTTSVALISVVIAGLVFICKDLISNSLLSSASYAEYIKYAAICIPAAVITLVSRALLRSDKKSGLDGLLKNTFHWIVVGVVLIFALTNFDSGIDTNLQYSILAGFYSSAVLSLSLALYYYNQSANNDEMEREGLPNLSQLLQASYPLFLVAVMHNMNIGLDKFIVAGQLSISDVGLYDIIIKVNALTGIVFLAVNSTLSPRVAELYGQKSMEGIEKVAVASTKVIILATLPLILVGLLICLFMPMIFGDEYRAAQVPLVVLLLFQIPVSALGSAEIVLQMTDNQKVFMKIFVVATVCTFLLMFVLIPFLGLLGAILAKAVGVLTWRCMAWWSARRILDIDTLCLPFR